MFPPRRKFLTQLEGVWQPYQWLELWVEQLARDQSEPRLELAALV
ncbi:hypothetical protein [Mumia zhuanghuii]|nr:hypothetical protein [Mumia zhuanghuii]